MGGFAKRMWPVTKDFPKGLLPLGRKTILDHILDKIISIKGKLSDDIYISTNMYFADQISNWIKKRKIDVKIIVEKTKSENEKLGAVGGLRYALQYIQSSDGYLVIAGDNYFEDSLNNLIDTYYKYKETVISIYKLGDLELAKKYGVVMIDDDGVIIKMVEKPITPFSDTICTAIYLFNSNLPDLLEKYLCSTTLKDRLGDFVSWLVSREKVYSYRLNGEWIDIGGLNEYINILKRRFSGIHISHNCKIINSKFSGSVVIMDNAKIINSHLKNCVILPNTTVVNSKIYDSLIGINRNIVNKEINSCLI